MPVDPQRHSTASLKESASSFKNMENRKTSGKVDSSARGSIDRASSDHGRSETSAAESDSSNLDSSDSRFSNDSGYTDVISARQKKKDRGRGPKLK